MSKESDSESEGYLDSKAYKQMLRLPPNAPMRIMAPHRDKDYKGAAARLAQYQDAKNKKTNIRDARRH